MKIDWSNPARQAASRAHVEFENRVRALHFWERIDAVLLTLLAVLLLSLLIAFGFSVVSANQSGLFDRDVIKPLADERLLINLRNEIATRALLDGVFHPPDQKLYISQADGWIHTYAPATGLWNSSRPFANSLLRDPNLFLLRSGCGADPEHELADPCADPTSVWGLTASNGLVRHDNSGWNVVYGDSAFIGARSKPVEADELTTAALSADGKWLLVGTKQDGIGLYDNLTHTWVQLDPELYAALPALQITHLAWAQDQFWIGGPKGLAVLEPDSRAPKVVPVQTETGRVLDLDVAFDGRVWALLTRPCQTGKAECLWLGAFSDLDNVQVLLHEKGIYPQLNGTDLIFAQYYPVQQQIVVAGAPGIYRYDTRLHAWEALFDGNVKTALPFSTGRGFYVGYVGGVGAVDENGFQVIGALEGQTFIKLAQTARPELLALAERAPTRAVYSFPLTGAAPPTLVFQTPNTPFDPTQFTDALALDNTVLFKSSEGIVLHDVLARGYQFIPSVALPSWLYQPDTRLQSSGNFLYGLVSPNASPSSYYALPSTSMNSFSNFTNELQNAHAQSLPGPVKQLWKWDADSIGILGEQESVFRLTPQGATRVTGAPLAELNGAQWFDAAARGSDFYFSTPKGLWRYDGTLRTWDTAVPLPENTEPRELVQFDGQILAQTARGGLVRAASAPTPLIPSDALESQIAGLSDARREGESLYLAGQGRVERYALDERRVTGRWRLEKTDAPLHLQGIVNETPLSLAQARAYLGESILDADAGAVRNLSLDTNTIWTVRELNGTRYLKGYDYKGTPTRCFFRNPRTSGSVRTLTDALRLSNGVVVVSTNAGLWFYNPEAHSWYPGPPEFSDAGGRLYVMGSYLVIIWSSGNETQLTFVPETSIALPSSCESGAVRFDAQRAAAVAATVDQATGRAAWLTRDGAVMEWQNGQMNSILSAATNGPSGGALRRVYSRPAELFFTTADAVWKYEWARRVWTRLALRGVDKTTIADLNIEFENDSATVIARSKEGRFYLGAFQTNDTEILLQEIFSPPAETHRLDPNGLLDVQMRGDGVWTLVLADRLRYYDPRARRWLADAKLEPDATREFGRIAGWSVATGENGRVWWIAQDNTNHPAVLNKYVLRAQETTALDTTGSVWRWQPNGAILRCKAPFSDAACERVTPETFFIDPNQVHSAYTWRGLEFLELTNGLRAFDPKLNQQVALPPEIVGFTNPSTRRVVGSELWLHRPNTLVILTSAGDGTIKASFTDNARTFVLDERGEAWAQIGGQWLKRSGSDWSVPRAENGHSAGEAGIRVFANEASITTGLGADGALYSWSSALRASRWRLPENIAASAVTALYRVNEDAWWAQAGSRLYHLTPGVCPSAVQPTPLPTDTATRPAPTPIGEPCLQVEWEGALPVRFAETGQTRLVRILDAQTMLIWNEAGVSVLVQRDANDKYQVGETADLFPPLQGAVRNEWNDLSKYVVALPNGRYAFNPITALTRNLFGELVAQHPRGEIRLGVQGSLSFDRAPVLDVGWLQWERSGKNFLVMTPTGKQTLTPQQFIRDGAFVFERVEAILASNSARLFTANAYGITSFVNRDLALDDRNITFQPIDLALSIAAVRGQFHTSNGALAPGDAQAQTSNPEYRIQLEDLEIVEDIRAQRIRAQAPVVGKAQNVLTDNGFLWDDARRGLAYENGALQLVSALGIGPLDRLAGFYAEPAGNGSGQLVTEGARLYFHTATGWFERRSNSWQPSGDPTANRNLFQDARWAWIVQNSQVQVALQGTPHNFAATWTNEGYGFSSDQLRAAASANGQLYVVTDAFRQMGIATDALADWSAPRGAPLDADAFDTFTRPDGQVRLLRHVGTQISEWDSGQQQFTPVANSTNPYLFRPLVETDRLRLRLDNERVVPELRFDAAAGQGGWVAFALLEQRFPFDVVTSLAVFENQLYIGTAAGLEVHAAPLNPGVNAIQNLSDMRGGVGLPSPVMRVGAPYARPDVLMTQSTSACVERRAAANFAPCQAPSELESRLRVRNDFWEWTRGIDERAHGSYRDATGQALPADITPSNGRLAHDEIEQVVVCQNRAATLWKNGWVTVYPQAGLELPVGAQTFAFDEIPTRLSCIEREVDLQSERLAAGLYLQMGAARVLGYTGRAWTPLSNVSAGEVIDRSVRPRIYDHARLRLLQDANAFRFEQQTLGGKWVPLAWRHGHLELDEWNEFVVVNEQLWAATRAGLATFARDPDGRAVLDPDTLILVREPSFAFEPCALSDLSAVSARVTARCNFDSREVYEGDLDGARDANVFTRSTKGDPFVEQQLVDTTPDGKWIWKRVGYANGSPGNLESSLDTRAVELSAGRFGFDTLTSTAFYTQTLVEIATARGGAWQADVDRFGALAWHNPTSRRVEADAVSEVFKTRVGEQIGLCLKMQDQYAQIVAGIEPQRVEMCSEYLGADTLWIYAQNNGHLEILGNAAAVSATPRKLQAGRFTDDLVIGLPLASQVQALEYWLPTRAGIIQLDAQLFPTHLIAPPFAGLDPAKTPTALFLAAPREGETRTGEFPNLFYVGTDGIYQLLPTQKLQAALPPQTLGAREPLQVSRAGGRTLKLLLQDQGQRGWMWLDAETFAVLGTDRFSVDTQAFDDFQVVKTKCSPGAAQLNLDVLPHQVRVAEASGQRKIVTDLPAEFALQSAVHVRERVFLIGQHDVQELNLGAALRRVCGN